MGVDWRRIIAADDRELSYGEIFKIRDELITFPESLFAPRTFHFSRSVVIIHHSETNSDPHIWTVNVAPISSQIQFKRDTDLEIIPVKGNYIDRKSLIRLGIAQPVLKVDLEGPVGMLNREQKLQLSALQMKLAGIQV